MGVGAGIKDNPFAKLDFREIVKSATMLNDTKKIDELFRKEEAKLEEFFEQKKKYYKNLHHEQTFRTDALAE